MTDIREIIENIAVHLAPQDQYTCLTVCQTWYTPFLYLLYREIHVGSDKQLDLLKKTLISNPELGYLLRKLRLRENKLLRLGVGVQIPEYQAVKVQQDFLDAIETHCPYIESISCDESTSVQIQPSLLNRLNGLSTLNHRYMKTWNGSSNLTSLHVCGNIDIVQGSNSVIQMLSYVPNLTHLTLERDEFQNKYKTPIISLEHLECIHEKLPKLQDLQFLNHFNFGISNYYLYQHDKTVDRYPNLVHIKLEGTLQSYQWLQFISYAYPSLTSLGLDLVHSPFSNPDSHFVPSMQHINTQIKEAFRTIAQQCPQLSSILIKGLSTPLWLTPQFVSAQNNKPFRTFMDVQLYGLDSAGVENSVATLTNKSNTNIRLTGIRLPIWKKTDATKGKTWFDVMQPLSYYSSLTHLELDAVSMSFTDVSQHNGFELDTILDLFTHLKSLKLSGSHVLASSKQRTAMSRLQELCLQKMSFTPRTMEYISTHCLSLKRFIMYDCMQQPKTTSSVSKLAIQLDLSNLDLDLVVLYRIQHAHHMLQSRIPGARFLCLNQDAWFHLCEEDGVCALKSIDDQNRIDMIQRFNDTSVSEELWEPNSTRFHAQKEWLLDLAFGYIDVRCRSVRKLFVDSTLL